MKKIITLYSFLFLLLIGCSHQETPQHVSAKNEHEKSEENSNNSVNIPEYYDSYSSNPQVIDDRSIQELGKNFHDTKGEATLEAITTKSQTKKIGAIEVTIKEAKVIHFKPAYSLIDFYHTYTHDEEFTFVKFFIEINNTSDETFKFAPIAIIDTNENERNTWENDIYLEELNGEIEANSKKSGNIGFIIKKPNIHSIKITTSDLFNKDDKKINEAETINIQF